jgi:hypothetical protein
MTHKCTLSELQKKQVALKVKAILYPEKKEKPMDPKDKIANSNDFFFDRKKLKIVKKGQMELL